MNFESVTIQRFKVGIDFHFRTYSVIKKNNGFLTIINILTGKVLFENLNPDMVLINGNPMQSLNELQELIFNSNCECGDEMDDTEFKIFDLSFDKTFE